MSILIKLHVEDTVINLLDYNQSVTQNTDYTGRPSAKPVVQPISFSYETVKKDPFLEKLVSGKMSDYIKFVISPVSMNGKSTKIELLDFYVIECYESFNGVNNRPMTTYVTVSFATIIINGVVMDVKYWRKTDPNLINVAPTINYNQEQEEEKEFKISIKHIKNKDTFVPLGIPAYNGTKENKTLDFEIEVQQNEIESYKIEILQDDNVIFTVNSGEEGLPQTFDVGKHTFKWDGFDSNGIYDSKAFIKGNLKAKVTGRLEGNTKTAESDEISFERKEVDWVDAIINKNTKRIDITLRVNLRDGGEKGTEKDCHIIGSGNYSPVRKVCPWDDIPEDLIQKHGEPIKARTQTFEELRSLALNGVSKYWSRKLSNTKGTIINGENYVINVNAIQDKKGMKAPKIIFLTNKKPGRSRNWEFSRILFYNIGYLLYGNRWSFEGNNDEDYKMTSAHEIGHEILLSYGGQSYSKSHKDSSTIITQEDKGLQLPSQGEIDLMKYYEQYYDIPRTVASKKDVMGLLWLTKIKLK